MTPTLTRHVPFFDYRHGFVSEEDDLIRIFLDVGRRGAFILQDDLARFEAGLAQFLGARFAVGVANATDGLHLALRAAGIRPGDEVIFPSHTMAATAAAIHFAGAVPVAVECGPDHLIDPDAAAAAITPRTRAIIPVHLNGRTCAMDALAQIAARHGLMLIEDAAQALGSRYRGRAAGTFGAAGVFSFYPAKLLGCLGDGGAVVANDRAIFERLCELRDHGRSAGGEIVAWGLNSRLDNLQAAILDWRLSALPEAIVWRRDLARLYRQRLAGIEALTLPRGPDDDFDHYDAYQNYEIEAHERDTLRAFLQAKGIGTLLPWGGKAVHQCDGLRLSAHLPYTESLFEHMLLLPMNTSLADEDVHAVCDAIERFYRSI